MAATTTTTVATKIFFLGTKGKKNKQKKRTRVQIKKETLSGTARVPKLELVGQ